MPLHEFDIEAMNTSLRIQICAEDFIYAKSAAFACFAKTAAIEDLLSMYKFGSDISMINSARTGDVVKLTDTAQECLLSAFKANEMSKGAIDVCMGEFFLKAKGDRHFDIPAEPRRGKFAFDPENYLIQKLSDGLIDLGAIGKGFAVDKMVENLVEEWEIKSALISFGGSSVYALSAPDGADAWEIELAGAAKIPLKDAALGASGTAVQGAHIIDARTGKVPENMPFRTWAFGADAAVCDAMSTAFMLMAPEEISVACKEYGLAAALQRTDGAKIEFFETE